MDSLEDVAPCSDCIHADKHTDVKNPSRKLRRHYQIRCPGCGLFKIWKRKPAWMADDEFPEPINNRGDQ